MRHWPGAGTSELAAAVAPGISVERGISSTQSGISAE